MNSDVSRVVAGGAVFVYLRAMFELVLSLFFFSSLVLEVSNSRSLTEDHLHPESLIPLTGLGGCVPAGYRGALSCLASGSAM